MKKILFVMAFVSLAVTVSAQKSNPFMQEWDTPYGVPPFDKIKTEHYLPAFEAGMKQQMAEIKAITNNKQAPTFENTILAFENSGSTRFRAFFSTLPSAAIVLKWRRLQRKSIRNFRSMAIISC